MHFVMLILNLDAIFSVNPLIQNEILLEKFSFVSQLGVLFNFFEVPWSQCVM